MRILITPDIMEWAIGSLTKSIVRHAQHRFDFTVVPVHPRAATDPALHIRQLIKEQGQFDLWHCMYWNSGEQLLSLLPELRGIPSVLSHHNHYALQKADWSRYTKVVVPTGWSYDFLAPKYNNLIKIPYGIDLDRFSYIDERKDDGQTIGYVGRVVPHKNLARICQAAKNMGAKVLATGYVEKTDYYETVDKSVLEIHGGTGRGTMASQAFKDRLYERMTAFVMYSTGEVETGTLPLFEAMARGVPVLTTAQGSARDLITDGENGIIFNEENFAEKLAMLLADRKLQDRLRENAWKTVKGYPEEMMSLQYQKVYADIFAEGKKKISIIIPTKNRAELVAESLLSIEAQDYAYKEVIVVDDGSTDQKTDVVINAMRKHAKTPIILLRTGNNDGHYGLARARNIGVIEAIGDIVVLLDDRLKLAPNALTDIAASQMEPMRFYWGAKLVNNEESTKRTFIENFSWCRRDDLINAGLFPEWLQLYGGMSEEIRKRLATQGWQFVYNPKPTAEQMTGSGRYKHKDQVWKAKFLLRKLYG